MTLKALLHGASHLFPEWVIQDSAEYFKYVWLVLRQLEEELPP
jgi:hypothetical protein